MKKESVRIGFAIPAKAHKKLKLLCVETEQTVAQLVSYALEKTYDELKGELMQKEIV